MAVSRARRTLTLAPENLPGAWRLDPAQPLRVNVTGDYTYLTDGYYHSLDLEQRGEAVAPTSAECLDAYVVPIALEKAKRGGIGIPHAQLVTERFLTPPLMAYPVNPFSSRGELLADTASIEARRSGLSYTGKYAVLCQSLPLDFRIDTLRVIIGRCVSAEYQDFAETLWQTFRVPLMRVRVIVTEGAFLLSAIEPLPWKTLSAEERGWLEEAGTWHD